MPDDLTRLFPRTSKVRAALAPSLADLFFAVLLLALFARPQSWQSLLGDGDTGWHIRTGEYILQTGWVPFHDLFSFSRPNQPWFAWEWLSDVTFALLHRWHGLAAIAGFCAMVIALAAAVLFWWLLRRGAGLWISLAVTLAAVSASTIHYLARPHVFSLLFATLALWILDEDRRRRTGWVWLLAPLSALWANLHGGFAGWLAMLPVLVAAGALERNWAVVRRHSAVAAGCFAATLLNPYGWRLHQHIVGYLGSSWIMESVQEFQSPRIRSENMQVFALLLLAGVALAAFSLAEVQPGARRQWFEGALVLLWGFAALRSARHIPWFAVVVAPVLASQCARWWGARARRSPGGSTAVLWELGQELGQSRRIGLWTPLLGGLAMAVALPAGGTAAFPASRFPVTAVERTASWLVPVGPAPRILTSDQWGDYLIFRLYPRQRVFFDGRSDFYGPGIGTDYQMLLSAGRGWREAMGRYRFDLALLPLDWPLGSILEREPGWSVVYRDRVSVLFARGGLKEAAGTVECRAIAE